jgi:hypothetical protein
MKLYAVLYLLLSFSVFLHGQTKKVEITSKIKAKVPEAFYRMTDADVVRQYGVLNIPLAIFSHPNNKVRFSVTRRIDTLGTSDPIQYQSGANSDSYYLDQKMEASFMKSNLQAVYDSIYMIRDTIITIDKRDLIILEFEGFSTQKGQTGNLVDVGTYSILAYHITENKRYLFNFHCPLRYRADWQSTGREVIETLNFRGKL